MSLFKNRPLALFCFIFILSGVLIYKLDSGIKPILAMILLFCSAVCIAVGLIRSKLRIKTLFALLCFASALLAVILQFVMIDLKRTSDLSYEGEHTIKLLIVEEEYSSDYSGEYRVRIEKIDGERVSIPSVAVFAFGTDLSAGDTVCARADIYPSGTKILGYSRDVDENVYIQAAVYEEYDCVRISKGRVTLPILLTRMRSAVTEYMDTIFGAEASALARGFLLGDKSGIGAEVMRDFRRAGVLHLLAVSGLHISVIMGFAELILRKLGTGKRLRCVLLSVFALIFLALTGFSMSASRSVIMILCVYFSFLFVKENDSITALLVSVALIIIVFPHSVYDLGLWLSALATLGIIAVYIPLSSFWHRRRKRGVKGFLRYLLEKVSFAVLLTFICNTFICFVIWAVFEEISTVSLISNIVLSPMSELYVIMIAISMIFGAIPFIGTFLVRLLSLFGKGIVLLCGFFSNSKMAIISLRYKFAGIIIISMSICIAIMLIIKLKHKWTIIIPPIIAVAAFVACLTGYNIIHKGEVSSVYYSEGDNEMIVLCEKYSAAICDISSGTYSFMINSLDILEDNMSTEISEYVVTHYHLRQSATLERFFRETLLRKIYLPYPENADEYKVMSEIAEAAEKYGVDIRVYKVGERLSVLGKAWLAVIADNGSPHPSVSVVIENGNDILSYIGTGNMKNDYINSISSKSDHIIFGKHGVLLTDNFIYDIDDTRLECVFYADVNIYESSDIPLGDYIVCVPPIEEKKIRFNLILRS